jgi:hypothetical protein
LGRGDGLYRDSDGVVTRFQAPLVTDKDINKTLRTAQTMPQPSYHVDGLMQSAVAMPSFDGLSEYDAAVLLCESLEWISPKDLLDNGIVRSRSQAKKVLSALRDGGHIGSYDAAINKSPVVKVVTNSGHDNHGKTTKNAVVATDDHVLRMVN